jgi:hypothetical protein
MSTCRTLSLGLGLALALASPGLALEIVYDNSASVIGSVGADLDEFGDQVTLAGTARTVTDFTFSFAGAFDADGDESVRVRFYENDGTAGAPGTAFFDSGSLAVAPPSGAAEFTLSGLSVSVPDTFTWTVQFAGMTGAGDDRALVSFANPPSVGSSDVSFYWIAVSGGWAAFAPGGQGNLYARIAAVPEPAAGALAPLALLALAARRRAG